MTDKLQELRAQTRKRDAAIWRPYDLQGLGNPQMEALLDRLQQGSTAIYQTIVDAEMEAEQAHRDLSYDAALKEIAGDRQTALARHKALKTALAIRHAADLLLLSVREYEAKAKQVLMAAREYAAEVEKEQIDLERLRAETAAKKEELRVREINARAYFEVVEQKLLEAEKAKTQLEVARANIKALMANIEAEQAELRVIQQELEVAMTEADQATLNSDIALIIADITTRCLAGIRLGVEREEIRETRAHIQQNLTDTLNMLQKRTLIENIRRDAELNVQAELWRYLYSEKALEAVKLYNTQQDLAVARKEIEVVLNEARKDGLSRRDVGLAKAVAVAARSRAKIAIAQAETDAKLAQYAAQQSVYEESTYEDNYRETIDQTIISE